jgi:hypothetical protein
MERKVLERDRAPAPRVGLALVHAVPAHTLLERQKLLEAFPPISA